MSELYPGEAADLAEAVASADADRQAAEAAYDAAMPGTIEQDDARIAAYYAGLAYGWALLEQERFQKAQAGT